MIDDSSSKNINSSIIYLPKFECLCLSKLNANSDVNF